MRGFMGIFLIALLGCIPAHASAVDATVFPPDSTTCSQGQMNLIVWDGMHNVYCLPVPVCPGPNQILQFNEGTFTCFPGPSK